MSLLTRVSAIPMVLVLLGAVPRAEAEPDLARQYVELLRYDQQFNEMNENCLSMAKKLPLESFLASQVRECRLNPSSKNWPKAVSAYEEYNRRLCATPTKEEFLSALAAAYRERLSPAQLQQAIKFYSGDVGRELVKAHKLASYRVNEVISDAQAVEVPPALQAFLRHLDAIDRLEAEGAK